MIILIALAAALYLALGNHFWRIIVMRPMDERHLIGVQTKEQFWDEIDIYANLQEGEKAQTSTHLLVKASFLLIWPVILPCCKVAAMWADWKS
jgi:hypothetical protein